MGEQLDEAERWNDPERAARVRAERDFVARELGAAGVFCSYHPERTE